MKQQWYKHLVLGAFSYFCLLTPQALAQAEKVTPLDPSVEIPQEDDAVSSVFKDMVVVQKKAKKKAGSVLLSTYGTIDFSDGPITGYGLNTNIGYAINDFWEIYLNFVPAFIVNERPIVAKVRTLTLASGGQANIIYSRPLRQIGGEILWLPAYGKESWGPYSIVRSDTFFKLGVAQVSFESNQTGLRFSGMLGKTYYLAKYLNIRVGAGVSYAESIVENEKKFNWFPVLEAGLVFYF